MSFWSVTKHIDKNSNCESTEDMIIVLVVLTWVRFMKKEKAECIEFLKSLDVSLKLFEVWCSFKGTLLLSSYIHVRVSMPSMRNFVENILTKLFQICRIAPQLSIFFIFPLDFEEEHIF